MIFWQLNFILSLLCWNFNFARPVGGSKSLGMDMDAFDLLIEQIGEIDAKDQIEEYWKTMVYGLHLEKNLYFNFKKYK